MMTLIALIIIMIIIKCLASVFVEYDVYLWIQFYSGCRPVVFDRIRKDISRDIDGLIWKRIHKGETNHFIISVYSSRFLRSFPCDQAGCNWTNSTHPTLPLRSKFDLDRFWRVWAVYDLQLKAWSFYTLWLYEKCFVLHLNSCSSVPA